MQPVLPPGILNAYRASSPLTSGAADAAASQGSPAAGASTREFADVLSGLITGSADQERAAATASVAGLTGRQGTTDVVIALSRAELAVQTVVALRDRVVAAYQEVMRMPI